MAIPSYGTGFASTTSATAYQGTPGHYVPAFGVSDGLHPIPAGPIDSVAGAITAGVLLYAWWNRPRVERERH